MEGLRTVRKRAGYTQGELADSIGTSRPNVSAYESGGRTLTLKMANRVLKEIGESDVSGAELVVANRLKAYKRARSAGDVSGMLEAARAVAKIGEEHTLTREGDELVDEVVDDALEYAEKVAVGFDDEAEDEGGDGRDLFGRRITPLDDPEDDRDAFGRRMSPAGNLSEGRESAQDEEDEEDDGRDMYGRRVRPLDEAGDGQDEDEDEEDGRDMYGRRI